MRRAVVLLTLVFVLAFMGVAYAVEVELFNDTFIRGTGTPVSEFRNFNIKGIGGPATLKITNGAEDDTYEKVSSSVIKVNGVTIADASNFNQNVFYVNKEITLNDGYNTVEVLLKSKPGGAINIRIFKNENAEAAEIIGSEGGKLSIDEEIQLEIPEGIFNEDTIITIEKVDQYPGQGSVAILSQVYDIKAAGQQTFNKEVKIRIPYNPSELTSEEEKNLSIHYWDDQQEEWLPIPGYVDKAAQQVYGRVNHFTLFGIIIEARCLLETGDDKDLCEYSLTLDHDIDCLDDSKETLIRAIGQSRYDSIYTNVINSRDTAFAKVGTQVDPITMEKIRTYLSAKETMESQLNDFLNNGTESSYSEGFSNACRLIDLWGSIDTALNIVTNLNWSSLLTGYAFGKLVKAELGLAWEWFETSAGAANTAIDIDNIFFRLDEFEGNMILQEEYQNIPLFSSGKTVQQIPKLLDGISEKTLGFSFNLFEPSGSVFDSWQVCTDTVLGYCTKTISYPLTTEDISSNSDGTYAFIFAFGGYDDAIEKAGISLTVDDKLIAYTIYDRPFGGNEAIQNLKKWGRILIARKAFTNLPSGQLTVELRLFKEEDSYDQPSIFKSYPVTIEEGKYTLANIDPDPAGSWSSPEVIYESPQQPMSFAFDAGGNWHAVYWSSESDGNKNYTYINYINATSSPQVIAWAEEQDYEDPVEGPVFSGEQVYNPSIVFDPSGRLHILYSLNRHDVSPHNLIMHRYR